MTKKPPPPSSTSEKDDNATAMKDPSSRKPPPTATASAAAASVAVETASVDERASPPVSSYNATMEQYWRSEFDSKSTELKMEDKEPLPTLLQASEKTETKTPPTAKPPPASSSKKQKPPPLSKTPPLPQAAASAKKSINSKCSSNSSIENDMKAKSVSNLGPIPTTTNTEDNNAEADALMYILEDVLEKGQGHRAVNSSDDKKNKNDYVSYPRNENNNTSYHCNNAGRVSVSSKSCGSGGGESIINSDDHTTPTNHAGMVSVPGAFRQDGPEVRSRDGQDDYEEDDGEQDGYSYHGNSHYDSSHGDGSHRDSRSRYSINSSRASISTAQYSENGRTDGLGTVSTSNSTVHGNNYGGRSRVEVGESGVGSHAVDNLQPSKAAPVILEARRVDEDSDSESSKEIVYAHDVKLDNFKRRILYLIVFVSLGATLTVAFVVVRARNQRNANQNVNDQTCIFTDEICCQYDFDEELPIPKSIPLLCHCNQSLSYVEDSLTDVGLIAVQMLRSQGMDNHSSTVIFDPNDPLNETTVCQPHNQLYLSAATIPESELEASHITIAADTIFENAIALTELYIQMEGFSWANSASWLETIAICPWFGVECLFIDTLSGLNLAQNGLKGQIPSTLGLLKTVRSLSLSDNPGIVGSIPSTFGNMIALNHLDLSHNNFTETSIPSTLGDLYRLRDLKLAHCSLSTSIPSELYRLTTLHNLYLNNNRLTGSISSGIANMTQLSVLNLHDNMLTGTVPADISRISSLEVFDISNNSFSGTFPSEIATMPRLSWINLVDSGLDPILPSTLCDTDFYREVIVRCNGMNSTATTSQACVRCFEDLPAPVVAASNAG
mmetsp:Transcript_14739/g.36053  ORF Transcript_14739/g.36053 Transcript_14739/m.36053 type:complete len:838 (+) Transcript_14739:82-2595(+)